MGGVKGRPVGSYRGGWRTWGGGLGHGGEERPVGRIWGFGEGVQADGWTGGRNGPRGVGGWRIGQRPVGLASRRGGGTGVEERPVGHDRRVGVRGLVCFKATGSGSGSGVGQTSWSVGLLARRPGVQHGPEAGATGGEQVNQLVDPRGGPGDLDEMARGS